MKDKDKREIPDYVYDYNASLNLVRDIRAYYAKLEAPVKVWIDETIVPYGGKDRKLYSIRSNITFKVSQ